MNNQKQNRQGFTLLETVVGLSIFCLLTVISLSNLKDYQERMEEKQSLEWFKNTFKSAFNRAFLTHSGIELIVENENEMIFNITNGKGKKNKRVSKKFPKTISIFEDSNSEYLIYGTGQAHPVTFTFKSKLTHKNYVYVIQMGWGEIIEKKT